MHRLLAIAFLLTSASALADRAKDTQHSISITVDPLLAIPTHSVTPATHDGAQVDGPTVQLFEVTGEYRVLDKVGVVAYGGWGPWSDPSGMKGSNYVVATQGLFYPFGYFEHGMQAGLEAVYIGTTGGTASVKGGASTFGAGPLLGYKIATNVGFTFEAQAGADYLAARASASDGTISSTASSSQWVPRLRIQLGWSF